MSAVGGRQAAKSSGPGRWWRRSGVSVLLASGALLLSGCFIISPAWAPSGTFPAQFVASESIACPSTTTCYSLGDTTSGVGGGVAATSDGGSSWNVQRGPGLSQSRLACPSVSVCVAVGYGVSGLAAADTTDGGSTWSRQTIITESGFMNGVSCPSVMTCFAVGEAFPPSSQATGVIFSTSDGGQTWTQQPLPYAGLVRLNAIACPSSTTCFILGEIAGTYGTGVVSVTTDGGASWSTQPVGFDSPEGLACSSTTSCVAVGSGVGTVTTTSIVVTDNGGASWMAPTVSSGSQDVATTGGVLSAVGCAAGGPCFAFGTLPGGGTGTLLKTSDGVSGWVAESLPGGLQTVDGIACPSTTTCFLAGSQTTSVPVVVATTDGGSTWSVGSLPWDTGPSNFAGIACPSTDTCFAVGSSGGDLKTPTSGIVEATTNGGTTWNAQALPAGVSVLAAIACPSTTTCLTVGQGGVDITSDGGATWRNAGVTLQSGSFDAIACPTVSTCFIVGSIWSGSRYTDVAMVSTDSASTWADLPVPSGQGGFSAIACPSTTVCYLVHGNTIVATADGGTTWTSQTLTGIIGIATIACPATTTCFVAGFTTMPAMALAVTSDGATWSTEPLPPGLGDTTGIACPSTTTCHSVGVTTDGISSVGTAAVTTDGGADWTLQSLASGVGRLTGVSCPSVSGCFASGQGNGVWGGLIVTASFPAQTQTSASVGPDPVGAGQPVTFSVSVSSGILGTPSGTVTLKVSGITLCTVSLSNGAGSCSSTSAPVGSDTVEADYSGDSTYGSSTGIASLTVTN